MLDPERVAKFICHAFKIYEKCRGNAVKSLTDTPFWDVVILTAGDAEQQKVFESQLEAKHSRRELPTDVPFHVFSDPPHTKSGNGGATINSLAQLESIYAEKLSSMRILLIHAGGQSQRLPSASVMGKIFTAIPIGEKLYDMLDLNLAAFLPFLKRMNPGVFVTCSDVILPYDLDCDDDCDWSFKNPGFTVLAHPSPVKIGTKHGVYVLKDAGMALEQSVCSVECLKVLQKPDEMAMRKCGAVVSRNGKEFVYTDSVFFFDHDVTSRFLKFHAECGPITCEIDAYGDFLQGLGPLANSDYIHNMTNVSKVNPELLQMRLKVFSLVKCLPLTTVTLNDSKFYHLGTMQEYVVNFCEDETLRRVMNFRRDDFNKYLEDDAESSGSLEGTILHSILPSSSSIPRKAVVEFCKFNIPLRIGEDCIISNCQYSFSEDENSPKSAPKVLDFPSNTFIHTVPVRSGTSLLHIAIMCSLDDDLKKSVPMSRVNELLYFGQNFTNVLKAWGQSVEDIFPDTDTCCLWEARLFPAMPSMGKALAASLGLLHRLLSHDDFNSKTGTPDGMSWFSMADMLKIKDVSAMLAYRNSLYETIQSSF